MSTFVLSLESGTPFMARGMAIEFKSCRSAYCATCRRRRFIREFAEGDGCSFCGGVALYGSKAEHRAIRPALPIQHPAYQLHRVAAIDHETRTVTYKRVSAHDAVPSDGLSVRLERVH